MYFLRLSRGVDLKVSWAGLLRYLACDQARPFFWAIAIAISGASSHARAGLLSDRMDSVPQCIVLKNDLSQGSLDFLLAIDNEFGDGNRLPDFGQFLGAMSKDEKMFPGNEFSKVWGMFLAAQRAVISSNDLSNLYLSRWRSLEKFSSKYRVTDAYLPPYSVSKSSTTVQTLLRSGRKFRLDVEHLTPLGKIKLDVKSFDGELYRKMIVSPSSQCHGFIAKDYISYSESLFFPFGSLMRNARILPSGDDVLGDVADSLLAVAKASGVYETEVVIDGVHCVVLGSSLWQLYLSRDHGYAVKRAVSNRYALGKSESGRYLKLSDNYYILDNSDFMQVMPGLWLPEKSKYRQYQDGAIVGHYDTIVESFESPSKIKGSVFTDIFDEDCMVSNRVIDRTFRSSSPDGSAPPAAEFNYSATSEGSSRIVLIALNVVAIFVIVALIFWKKKNNSGG